MMINVLRDPAEWTPTRHYIFARDDYHTAGEYADGKHQGSYRAKMASAGQNQLALLAQTYNKLETLEGKVDAIATRLDAMG